MAWSSPMIADPARALLVMAHEEVPLDQAAVAVAEGEHPGAVEEGVAAVDVPAGFVGDDLELAVAAVEEVVARPACPNRSSTGGCSRRGSSRRRCGRAAARAEVVVVDAMVVGLALRLDLQRRRIARLAGEVAVVQAILGAEYVNIKLECAANDRGVGQTAMPAREPHAVARRCAALQAQPADDEMFSVDHERRPARQDHLARHLGAERDGLLRRPLAVKRNQLVVPGDRWP